MCSLMFVKWKKSKYNMMKLKAIKPKRELLLLKLLMQLVLLTKTNTIINKRLKRSQQKMKVTKVKPPKRKALPQDTSIWLWNTLAAPETKLLKH